MTCPFLTHKLLSTSYCDSVHNCLCYKLVVSSKRPDEQLILLQKQGLGCIYDNVVLKLQHQVLQCIRPTPRHALTAPAQQFQG